MARRGLSGDWDRTGKLLILASKKLEEEARNALEESAKIYYDEIIKVIEEGLQSWPRLTQGWLKNKGHEGFYQYKGAFKAGIDIRRVRGAYRGQKIFVGASPYRVHYSGLRMDIIADILQYNYDRPLFGPAWENVKRDVESRLGEVGANLFE